MDDNTIKKVMSELGKRSAEARAKDPDYRKKMAEIARKPRKKRKKD